MASNTVKLPDFSELLHRLEALLDEAAAIRERAAEALRRSRSTPFWPERRSLPGSTRIPERREEQIELGRMSNSWLAARRDTPTDEL